MNFMNALRGRWQQANSLLCVGLDPDPARLPLTYLSRSEPLFDFCKNIIDSTADYVCAFKPQIAHFAAQGAESVLEEIIDYIHNAIALMP